MFVQQGKGENVFIDIFQYIENSRTSSVGHNLNLSLTAIKHLLHGVSVFPVHIR